MVSVLTSLPNEVKKFFPFASLRKGQSLLAREIYYAILSKKNVVIEAANGIGKTITSLAATLPIIENEDKKLVFCTRTHTQMQRVLEELTRIREVNGWQINGIGLEGKAEMCINSEVRGVAPSMTEVINLCSHLRKDGACEFFINLVNNHSIIEGLKNHTLSASNLIDTGLKTKTCPYYLAKKLMKFCNVITTTYLYTIDPSIRNIFLNDLELTLSDCIIIFDECHNLHELVISSASNYISSITLTRSINEMNIYAIKDSNVEKLIHSLLVLFENESMNYKGHYNEEEYPISKRPIKIIFSSLDMTILQVASKIKNFGIQVKQIKISKGIPPRSSLYRLGEFLITLIQTLDDRKFIHLYKFQRIDGKINAQYHIKCLDARPAINELLDSRALLCMSGTLEPIEAFLDLCGFSRFDTSYRVLPSPFSNKQLLILAMQGLDSKYYNRTIENYRTFKNHCLDVITNTPENTGIFCASYQVQKGLINAGLYDDLMDLNIEMFVSRRDISSEDNNDMIQEYKEIGRNKGKAVLLDVCGGRNSEGVDFPGPEMESVIIVGLPLPKPSYFLTQLEKYYNEQFGIDKGKEYSQILPALRRANQAAGRPVRRIIDKGAIIFLDERFNFSYYKRCLSNWIRSNMVTIPNHKGILKKKIADFYSQN